MKSPHVYSICCIVAPAGQPTGALLTFGIEDNLLIGILTGIPNEATNVLTRFYDPSINLDINNSNNGKYLYTIHPISNNAA